MSNGVYSRREIRALRRTLDVVFQGSGALSPLLRERVARIAVRIADERDVFDPSELVALVQAEIRNTGGLAG